MRTKSRDTSHTHNIKATLVWCNSQCGIPSMALMIFGSNCWYWNLLLGVRVDLARVSLSQKQSISLRAS